MRPTFDEQLAGADRLLRLAETDPQTSPAVAELVRNACRLVDRIAGAWTTALPFLLEDNARTAALLGLSAGVAPDTDLARAARRNEQLRAALVQRIHELPAGPGRAAIGAHLRSRIDTDPT